MPVFPRDARQHQGHADGTSQIKTNDYRQAAVQKTILLNRETDSRFFPIKPQQNRLIAERSLSFGYQSFRFHDKLKKKFCDSIRDSAVVEKE